VAAVHRQAQGIPAGGSLLLREPARRAALRTAVTGTGPVKFGMAALAGLVHAGNIAPLLYPGRENASLRAKLAELAGQDPATTVPGTRPGTGSSDDPLMHAAAAAVQSAVHHSVHAAVSAAITTSHHSGGSSPGGDSSAGHHSSSGGDSSAGHHH
jgi:hypothetical protein